MTASTGIWDVIVVGGGPAGSTAARRLARRGARTLLLEKREHPRYKACGGGVPLRTAGFLDLPFDEVVEGAVTGIEVSRLGEACFRKQAGGPVAYMVMRDRFDERLLHAAADAGVVVHEGETVRATDIGLEAPEVTTDRGAYRARHVLAADGATGATGRSVGLGTRMAKSAAYELELAAPAEALDRWRGLANVDVGYRPWGYGWVFPKQGLLSVGVVLSPGQGNGIREWTAGYRKRLGLHDTQATVATGHPIRYRRSAEEAIADGPLLLLGDAAGLADEFTAEGIAYAVHSGLLAADAVLADDGQAARRYTRAVNREIQAELDAARAISRMYYWCVTTWPALALGVSGGMDYLWRAFFRVMRGESTYAREVRRIPGLGLSARLF